MKVLGKLPTIPEYYKEFIDKSVDLIETPKICCPFHNEDTPSFSYSAELNKWRCFGACKTGGDVIALHQKHYKLSSRQQAIDSLSKMYNVKQKVDFNKDSYVLTDSDKIEFESVLRKVIINANTVDRWLELDQVMSEYPVTVFNLYGLLDKWGM